MNRNLLPGARRFPQQSTVDYYQAVKGPLMAYKDGSLGRIGQFVASTSPIVAAARSLRQQQQYNVRGASGLGEFAPPRIVLGMGVLALFILSGALSYQTGKAMAPNRAKAKSWGWMGVPVGMFTGPWGLGIMGIVSNSETRK